MNRISHNIRKTKNQEMTEYHLRSSHISCLYYLYQTENLTVTDLCEKCEEDKATISRSLEYLETNGYLTCESKNAKRYKSPLVLTEKGLWGDELENLKYTTIGSVIGTHAGPGAVAVAFFKK